MLPRSGSIGFRVSNLKLFSTIRGRTSIGISAPRCWRGATGYPTRLHEPVSYPARERPDSRRQFAKVAGNIHEKIQGKDRDPLHLSSFEIGYIRYHTDHPQHSALAVEEGAPAAP